MRSTSAVASAAQSALVRTRLHGAVREPVNGEAGTGDARSAAGTSRGDARSRRSLPGRARRARRAAPARGGHGGHRVDAVEPCREHVVRQRRGAQRAAGQAKRGMSEANGGARDTRPKGRDRAAGSAGKPGREATRPDSPQRSAHRSPSSAPSAASRAAPASGPASASSAARAARGGLARRHGDIGRAAHGERPSARPGAGEGRRSRRGARRRRRRATRRRAARWRRGVRPKREGGPRRRSDAARRGGALRRRSVRRGCRA